MSEEAAGGVISEVPWKQKVILLDAYSVFAPSRG